MPNFLDKLLNSITIYRLILYYLIALLALATIESRLGILSFDTLSLAVSVIFILAVSYITNYIFAKAFNAPRNVESVYITSLILALIITPTITIGGLMFLFWAAVLSNASKYILALNHKHIFNPAALAVFITSVSIHQSASWWVGTVGMLPAVVIGGILIVKKISKTPMVFSFLIISLLSSLLLGLINGSDIITIFKQIALDSPWLFFSFVMLTEPLTTPSTRENQIYYGGLIGLLFSPQIHLGSIYTTPELTLVLGNIYSFLVNPKGKPILTLIDKIKLGPNLYDFVFKSDRKLDFKPGQYLEWTLEHPKADTRGNRRYFTIASSPTENQLRTGVRFYPESSSFKKALFNLKQNSQIVASQLMGDFVLPNDKNRKLVFIAGGIGITPFRSMVKYLLDKREARDIILLYSNKSADEIIYQDVFEEARKSLGLRVIYFLTDKESLPVNWRGGVGRITQEVLKSEVKDLEDRTFYISGPLSLVSDFKETLRKLGVRSSQIATDYFPGFGA